MKPKSNPFVRSASLAVIALTLGTANATIYVWDGGAATTNWTDGDNWNPNGTQAPLGVTGAHRLNINSTQKVIYDFTTSPTNYTGDPTPSTGGGRGLVIGNGASVRGELEITAGSFSTLGATAGDVIGNGSGAIAILTINGGTFIGTNAGTNLGIGGGPTSTLNVSAGTATTATLNMNATTATVNLSGSGILEVNNIARAGGTGNINFDGGTLRARQDQASFLTGLSNATVNTGGVTVDSGSFNITIGQVLLGGAGNGGLTKTGAGALTLSGANTFNGSTLISGGTLKLNNNLALQNSALVTTGAGLVNLETGITTPTIGGLSGATGDLATIISSGYGSVTALTLKPVAGSVTYSGSIADGATGMTLTKSGAGTQVLGGTNSYTGSTSVSGGILAIANKDALNGTSGISVATGGATLRIDVPDATSTTIGSGKSVSIAGNGASNFGALVGAASTNVTWAGGVVLAAGVISRIGGGDSGTMTVDGVISGADANAGVLFSRAPNSTTLLTKVNTYTGDTQFFQGGSTVTLKMGIANAINSASRVGLFSNTTGTANFDLNGYNQNIRALSDTFTGDLVVTNSSLTNDAELRLSTTDSQTFGGWIQDGASKKTSLVVAGSGTQIFTNVNTFTGGTRIDGGTLFLSHATDTLADTGAVNVNGGTLSLGNSGANSDTVGAVTLTSGSITGTTGTLTGTGSNFDVRSGNVSAKLGGTVGLDKTTGGTVTLSGTNTYTGATTVSAGTLFVTGALSNSAVTVGAAGTVGGTGTLGNGLTILAGGNLDLTGATLGANSTGILGITGGTLALGALSFADLVGWNASLADLGTYELIDGSFTVNFGSTLYTNATNAFDFGNGKKGYFTSGSLNAVIIPEPSAAALLGTLGTLILLRRRRVA